MTKAQLRTVYAHLASLAPPGPRPLTTDQLVELQEILEKLRGEMAAASGVVERGARLLEWRIPAANAPTMNEWGFWKVWRKARARRDLDDALAALLAAHPEAAHCGAEVMRWVRVTRFTVQPKLIDDAAVDQIGGKMPVDALVRAGVLAGDSPRHVRREARVEATKRGNTHVLVEVFAVAQEEVRGLDVVVHESVAPVERQRGMFTRHVMGGK